MVQAATKLEELPDNYDVQKPSSKIISDLKEITDRTEHLSDDETSDSEHEKKGRPVTQSILTVISKEYKNAFLVFLITMAISNPLFHRSFFSIPFISNYGEGGITTNIITAIVAVILFMVAKFFGI